MVKRFFFLFVIIGITAFFTPGFGVSQFPLFLTILLIFLIFSVFISYYTRLIYYPLFKALVSFTMCIIFLYLFEFFSIGYTISFIPIVLGSTAFAIFDYLISMDVTKVNF